ncbi:MAG: transcription termination factor Rho [Pelolinea sp.]|nr:transcription termination factor Rho [Pelolinea sp.]
MNVSELEKKPLTELRKIGVEIGIPDAEKRKKEYLMISIASRTSENIADDDAEAGEKGGGVLEIMPEGIGFLRENYQMSKNDIYVSQAQLRRLDLRNGDLIFGNVRPPRESERHYGLVHVESVNALPVDEAKNRIKFENLTPIFPEERINLETNKNVASTRMIDMIAPIGRGQRAMIVSPPKAGKTTILKEIANAVSANYPEINLIISLIGERPEEVTDMDRSVEGEVIASTFDEPVTSHVRTAEMTLNRAKRLVEIGHDVVILMDSLTRLARAYNLVVNPSGRTLSGGMDPSALYPPKRFYGAARNIEDGGSLTIIATALVETGSRLDDVVYEEFKGTGNMELHLSRRLQERRIFPAIDIERSSTRREELLIDPDILKQVWLMRRMYLQMIGQAPQGAGMEPSVAFEAIINKMNKTKNNVEFLEALTANK